MLLTSPTLTSPNLSFETQTASDAIPIPSDALAELLKATVADIVIVVELNPRSPDVT